MAAVCRRRLSGHRLGPVGAVRHADFCVELLILMDLRCLSCPFSCSTFCNASISNFLQVARLQAGLGLTLESPMGCLQCLISFLQHSQPAVIPCVQIFSASPAGDGAGRKVGLCGSVPAAIELHSCHVFLHVVGLALRLGLCGNVPIAIPSQRHNTFNVLLQVAGLDVGWGQRLDMEWDERAKRYSLERRLPPGRFTYKVWP